MTLRLRASMVVIGRLGLKRVRAKTWRMIKKRKMMRRVTQIQILPLRFLRFLPPLTPLEECVSVAAFVFETSDANMGGKRLIHT